MVACRVDGGETVDTSWKTLGNVGSQNTVGRSSVETLEEGEDLGVQGLGGLERRHKLHGNMTVTLDDTADQLLRSGIVSVGGVRERSGNQVANLEGDGERGVGLEGVEVLGEVEFGGRHVIDGRDITHGDGVTRTFLDLETIGDLLANTEADEVVRASKGVCFTSCLSLTIDVLNDGRIQRKAGVGVTSVSVGGWCSGGGRDGGERLGGKSS
jgi:hypothetical protein